MPQALIVDDEPNSVNAMAELVEKEGFTTATAGTLAEARGRLAEDRPDVILVDLMLPDGSGFLWTSERAGAWGPSTRRLAEVSTEGVPHEVRHRPFLLSRLTPEGKLEVGLEVDGRPLHMLMLAYMSPAEAARVSWA